MKPPRSIQLALESAIREATSIERLLPGMLARAVKKRGLEVPIRELESMATAIIGAQNNTLNLDLDLPCSLGATESEVQATLQSLIDELTASMPSEQERLLQVVSEATVSGIADVANGISNGIIAMSSLHSSELARAHNDRMQTVERLWGPAFDRLDFLRHLMLEFNISAVGLGLGVFSKPNIAQALDQLVGRAYEVVGEIVVLARSGYADGALARWRTLHEICVIGMFLAQQSDRCAEMYLWHHKIEELRLLHVDSASGTANVLNLHHDRYARGLRQQKASLVAKFGSDFVGDYGWASIELGRKKTTFRDLEKEVGLQRLRRGYQQANSAVHGGALATLTRVSVGVHAGSPSELPPAYGCEVAASYTASSIAMLTTTLCLNTGSADLLAMNMVIQNCVTEVRTLIDRSTARISVNSPRA